MALGGRGLLLNGNPGWRWSKLDGREAAKLAEELAPTSSLWTSQCRSSRHRRHRADREDPSEYGRHYAQHAFGRSLPGSRLSAAQRYLLKDSAEVDLVRSVQVVAQDAHFQPADRPDPAGGLHENTAAARAQDSSEILTDRERSAAAWPRKSTRKWRRSWLGTYTVETHRTNLMQKLNLTTQPRLCSTLSARRS
jgi:DNA-binding CsgD family transcriptional regulator